MNEEQKKETLSDAIVEHDKEFDEKMKKYDEEIAEMKTHILGEKKDK